MKLSEQERNERTAEARRLIHWSKEEFDSDQKLLRGQPPLVKAQTSETVVPLTREFGGLAMENDFVKILQRRRSNRVFTGERMTADQLSFLLWATQGVKGIRGNHYATLRTVPSAGARHPFETYLYVKSVEGLKPGYYHYLPMEHSLELLREEDPEKKDSAQRITDSVRGQKWALRANVIFYYSIVPYRGEWRYAFNAHRVMMMDAGHVTENLYLACTALGLGTCAIGAVDEEVGNGLFGLDGTEEYIFYAAPVGTVSDANEEQEQAFYAFLKEK